MLDLGIPGGQAQGVGGDFQLTLKMLEELKAKAKQTQDALTKAGWLAALIPQEYGGSGLGLTEASVIMEEINRSGGNSGACHGQMYNMGTLLRHGSEQQKQHYLPRIASGEWRLQSMGVTEPGTGTDTIDRLCHFFGCKVEDLMEHLPEVRAAESAAE